MSHIFGVGTDVVEVARMDKALLRHGDGFPEKILTTTELQVFKQQSYRGRFLAKNFAAKEAFAKATGLGIRFPVGLHEISVIHDGMGKPLFEYSAVLSQWMKERELLAHVSIADEKKYAVAFVVLEGAA